MPDIDIDFCYERRQEVINYVIKKYGADHVTQIITFGTMAARAVIRDVARVMDISYSTADKIAKMIPNELGINIKKALETNQELSSLYDSDMNIKKLIDMSIKLEGLPRHASTHAAGVLICDEPVINYVPLTKQNDGSISTQFTMNILADLGLLKMDFLGLRTLSVIQNTVNQIEKKYKFKININELDLSDHEVYELISSGKTEGVFQLESQGMKNFMKELKPTCIDDIVAGISLYRPGPMDFINKYIFGKNNKNKIKYLHPKLENILKSTYGCIVYQEQVMQIFRELAGYSFGRSDLVRRAMSKKKADVMEQERKNFIAGCIKNNISQKISEEIFNEMIDFAKYAFNKSHAVAYSIISFQTAWLKNYYPVEFMSALLTSVSDFTNKVVEYINECKSLNINLLAPDINKSDGDFCVESLNSKKSIRFGLSIIKSIGKNTIAQIISDRNKNGIYKSFYDFINRLENYETHELNKRNIENMIKCGLFDSLGGKRSQYMFVYKQILNGVTHIKRNVIAGQISMFDMFNDDNKNIDDLPDMPEYSKKALLGFEKEILGIYISGHPLDDLKDKLNKYINANSLMLINNKIADGKIITVGGLIVDKQIKITRTNKTMMFLKLEDLYGEIEIILFPKVYEKFSEQIFYDTPVLITGRVNLRENETEKIICDEIKILE
jgi:DNA polymerase-3 subunit alpha